MNEKREIVQDFSGGLNTLYAPNRIEPNQTPTSDNVWIETNALAQRRGSTYVRLLVESIGEYGISLFNIPFSSTETLFIYFGNNSRNFFCSTTDGSTFTVLKSATAGTASAANNSTAVTGQGTNWLSTVQAGDVFRITAENNYGVVQSVNSDTSITLTANYTANYTAQPYSIAASWPSSSRISVISMNSALWACGPGHNSTKWDGTNYTYNNNFPQALYSLVYKNYAFAANTSANPSRVSWSALKDPSTWPASNFIDVSPNDGFPIVGMFLDGQSIVVLKTKSAYRITGDIFDPSNPTYTLYPIYCDPDFNIGTAKTVQAFEGGYVMLGKYGMYLYDGYKITRMQQYDTLKSEWSNIPSVTLGSYPGINSEPSSMIVNGKYWLVVESNLYSHNAGYKNVVYVFDQKGSVWRWKLTGTGSISDLCYLNGTLYGVNGDFNQNFSNTGIMTLDTGNSDVINASFQPAGIAIAGTWTSKVYEYPSSQLFLRAYVHFKKQTSGTLTFGYRFDDSASFTTVTIDMTKGIGGGQRLISNAITLGQIGSAVQFQISDANNGETFEVYAIEFYRRNLR